MSWVELVVYVCSSFMTPGLDQKIEDAAGTQGVDKHLVLSVIYQESRCNSQAVGAVGELGLMQVSPRWHHDRMVRLNARNLLDVESNLRVGVDLLNELNITEDPLTALAIYNGGYTMPESSKKYASIVHNRYYEFLKMRGNDGT